jgi:D-serine deaminase-like pyridoxal phosphate-dependent protein
MQLNPLDPRFAQIPTPALVLDAVALDANIARMAALAKACNISLRPHAKAHKSLVIARRQCAAGAIGLACATLAEAEHLIDRQVPHILLTSPLAGEEKCARFVALSRRGPIASVVDDMSEALRLSALSDGLSLDLAIDVDVGQARTGVIDPGHAVTLAKQITALPNLRFVGVQGYAGHAQHLATFEERKKAARRSAERLREVVTALTEAGLRPGFVSGGGTGTANIDMREGPYTDLQVGSYLLMDAEYREIRDENSERLPFLQSLYILATVVSTCRAGEITIDAGTKALAVNGPLPDHLLGIPAGASYRFWGDEHGTIILPPGTKPPRTGARILIPATHCDPTVNLYPVYHVVTNEGPLSIWPIVGRYGWVRSKGESFRFDFDMDRD